MVFGGKIINGKRLILGIKHGLGGVSETTLAPFDPLTAFAWDCYFGSDVFDLENGDPIETWENLGTQNDCDYGYNEVYTEPSFGLSSMGGKPCAIFDSALDHLQCTNAFSGTACTLFIVMSHSKEAAEWANILATGYDANYFKIASRGDNGQLYVGTGAGSGVNIAHYAFDANEVFVLRVEFRGDTTKVFVNSTEISTTNSETFLPPNILHVGKQHGVMLAPSLNTVKIGFIGVSDELLTGSNAEQCEQFFAQEFGGFTI